LTRAARGVRAATVIARPYAPVFMPAFRWVAGGMSDPARDRDDEPQMRATTRMAATVMVASSRPGWSTGGNSSSSSSIRPAPNGGRQKAPRALLPAQARTAFPMRGRAAAVGKLASGRIRPF
jgi:hypothetical protein